MHRSGIGQVLAPDSNIKEEEEKAESNEFRGGLWSILAPDPNFSSPNPIKVNNPSSQVQVQAREQDQQEQDLYWQSQQQQQYYQTPSRTHHEEHHNRPSTSTSKPSFLSPSSSQITVSPKVERLVISAAKDLTQSMLSPANVWEDHKNFFSYCASTTELNEKKLKKVRKMLRKDPLLVSARASNMGNLVQNGFTPLHACSSVGNYNVAKILIEFEVELESESKSEMDNDHDNDNDQKQKDDESSTSTNDTPKTTTKHYPLDLDARDVQGRTALHIASVQGHIQIVQLLKEKMKERQGVEPLGEHAPTDLTGRTPLGWAATSRETKARKNMSQLKNELFSPGDKSVYGNKTPAFMRTGSCRTKDRVRESSSSGNMNMNIRQLSRPMDLNYGFADMPGHRIEMEDAICHACPILPSDESDADVGECGFFGVFDGHGDGGISSEFVAENIIPYSTSSDEWKSYEGGGGVAALSNALTTACKTADVDLKTMLSKGNSVRHGGSTGVMAVITSDSIIIGNVGDSRCILVQKCEQSPRDYDCEVSETVKGMEALSVEDANAKDTSETNKSASSPVSLSKGKDVCDTVVKALSTDHKPDLPLEMERIENSGMNVVEETFTIDGVTTTLSKIHKSHSDRIAVSRAFGDFDYKANDELKVEEQAIICTPEITVHSRDHVRDMFLILACDGVWDVMSNDEVGDFVVQKVEELGRQTGRPIDGAILPEVGDELLNKCLELGSTDNMSVLIVALPKCGEIEIDDATRALNFADV
jgi:serine/threonine protein phosphatase PrpC/ankyrin repeat protein